MNDSATMISIALVQPELVWENAEKNRINISSNLAKIEAQPDIIVLPEAFNTGFSMNAKHVAESMNGQTIEWMHLTAEQYNCAICGSLFVEENGAYFNRFVWVDDKGKMACYDKRHLFSMGDEQVNYTAGKEQLLIHYKGWKIFPQICYDLRFPVWSRNTMGYDLLINVANWPAARQNVWQTLLKARAIENQCYVVGVNRVGRDGNNIEYIGGSLGINFKGEVLIDCEASDAIMGIQLDLQALKDFRLKFDTLKDADPFLLNG